MFASSWKDVGCLPPVLPSCNSTDFDETSNKLLPLENLLLILSGWCRGLTDFFCKGIFFYLWLMFHCFVIYELFIYYVTLFYPVHGVSKVIGLTSEKSLPPQSMLNIVISIYQQTVFEVRPKCSPTSLFQIFI
jgi:hypothetical protein